MLPVSRSAIIKSFASVSPTTCVCSLSPFLSSYMMVTDVDLQLPARAVAILQSMYVNSVVLMIVLRTTTAVSRMGGVPQSQMGGGYLSPRQRVSLIPGRGYPRPRWRGTPSKTRLGTPSQDRENWGTPWPSQDWAPPRDRTTEQMLATRRAVCLLRSRMRDVLVSIKSWITTF